MGHFSTKGQVAIGHADHIEKIKQVTLRIQTAVKGAENLRSMDPIRRRCYFPSEMGLRAFPEYSKENCELDCTWIEASEQCGCVPWFLRPHFPMSRLCQLHGNVCFRGFVDAYTNGSRVFDCGGQCLDDCEPLTIVMESVSPHDWPDIFKEPPCLPGASKGEHQSMACNYLRSRWNATDPIVRNMIWDEEEFL